MSWQAIIENVIQDPDAVVIEVVYTDNVSQKLSREYRLPTFDLNSFKRMVQSQIDQLMAKDTSSAKIPLGPFDPTTTPPVPSTKDLYAQNLLLFYHMTRAISAGVKTSGDKDYVDLQATLKADFDPSFLDLF